MSTTGAMLLQKNIAFDTGLLEEGENTDEISGVVSNPNSEDMFITVLTKKGKLLKYKIGLERHFDDSALLKEFAEPQEESE